MAKLPIEIKEAVEAARNSSQTELESEQHKDFLNRYDSLIAEAEKAVRGSPEERDAGLSAQKLLNRFIKKQSGSGALYD